MQIIPQEPGLGELLGSGIGAGVSTGLQSVLERRQKQAELSGLMKSLGLTGQTQPGQGGQPGQIPSTTTQGEIFQPEQNQQQMQIEKIATNPKAMAILSQMNPQAANQISQMYKNLLSERKLQSTQKFQERKLAAPTVNKYLDKIGSLETDIPSKEIGIMRINDALKSKDLKNFQNYFADYMESKGKPGDYFRTSAAAALQSGVKEFLLADLGKIKGGRPNQFIEMQLSASYPKAGYDPFANAKISAAMNTGIELNRKMVDTFHEIENSYLKKQGYLPSNIESQVNKILRPFAIEKEKELQNYYNELNKQEKSGIKFPKLKENKTENLAEFETMPSPKDHPGVVIEDDKGNKYKSDGSKWSKI